MRLKILFISYPFPPIGGMSKRNVYFANYLYSKGYDIYVLTTKPSNRTIGFDSRMLSLISPGINIIRIFPGVVHYLKYRFTIIRSTIGFLSSLEWAVNSLLYLLLNWKLKYDIIYCHGDPFLSHMLALVAKKIYKIPWVTYVGDPRCFGAYSKFRVLSKYLEPMSLRLSERIIVNCAETMEGYLNHFPELEANKFSIITDGFDSQLYDRLEPICSMRFRIFYSGIFYDGAREPFELIESIKKIGRSDIELVVAGNVSSTLRNYIIHEGLEDTVLLIGHKSYEEVAQLQKGAAVLLVLGWSKGYQLPGKLFEYFAAKRPILVIRYDNLDVSTKYILRYKRGISVEYDSEPITNAIKMLHKLWLEGKLDATYNLQDLLEFDWKILSSKLENIIRDVCYSK